jgi:hypothetical protein
LEDKFFDAQQKFESGRRSIELQKLYQPRCVVADDDEDFSEDDDQ